MARKYQFRNLSIQTKLILAFMLTSAIIIFVNGAMYINMNSMMRKVDQVYQSNVRLNAFSEELSKIDVNVKEYLETKSSEALNNYFRGEQKIEEQLEQMNSYTVSNEMMLLQKNIRNLTKEYLEVSQNAVQAKRGRNIERYRTSYHQAKEQFAYINSFIYSLNNKQFQDNSKNYEALARTLQYLEIVCVCILVFVSIANLIIIYGLTKRITKPLIRLAKTANEVGSGNLQVPLVSVEAMDEVGVVSKAFNQMILSIRKYIEKIRVSMEKENELKEKELIMEGHLKDARLKYLQAQINPHFLFNTLNAGAQLAMMEGADQTCTFIENMADFFRYNIKKIDQDTTVEEELAMVDHYIYILNVRFSGEIHYQKRIDEKYLGVRVPSMILQPLVENAVNHGIRNIQWEGRIEVSVYPKEMHLCISVKDNGIGMSKEMIEKVMSLEEISGQKKSSNGIAIANVMKRLDLYYHEENFFEIKSDGINKGTEVILYLPIL